MNDQEKLNGYVYRQLQSGLQPEEITQQLRTAGWDEATISLSFEATRANLTPASQPLATAEPSVAAPTVTFAPTGQKRGRIKTSWILLKQSLKVLQNNKQLIRYPFMGGLVSLLVTVLVAGFFIFGGDTFTVGSVDASGKVGSALTGYGIALSAVYYVLTFFVIFLYNAGLAAHVLDIFRGKSEPYGHYMKIARSKWLPILIYSIITATVGFILRTIEERFKFVGYFIRRIFGTLWALANLFTIPVIVESDVSAPTAIKQSTHLFLSRWGENIAARITFGGIAFGLYFLIIVPTLILTIMLGANFGGAGYIVDVVIFVLVTIIFATIETAAESVLSTALYFYAKYEQIPGAFESELLNATFVPKN